MERKVLLQNAQHHVWPTSIDLHMTITPFGVQNNTTITFPCVPCNAVWTFNMPVSVNSKLQTIVINNALRSNIGEIIESNRARQRLAEIIIDDIVPVSSTVGLSFVITSVQPYSYKNVFMDHVHVGTKTQPCVGQLTIDATMLADTQKNALSVAFSHIIRTAPVNVFYTTPSEIADVGYILRYKDICFNQVQNSRITFHLNQKVQGFALLQTVSALDAHGNYICFSPIAFQNSRSWILKSREDKDVVWQVGVINHLLGIDLNKDNKALAAILLAVFDAIQQPTLLLPSILVNFNVASDVVSNVVSDVVLDVVPRVGSVTKCAQGNKKSIVTDVPQKSPAHTAVSTGPVITVNNTPASSLGHVIAPFYKFVPTPTFLPMPPPFYFVPHMPMLYACQQNMFFNELSNQCSWSIWAQALTIVLDTVICDDEPNYLWNDLVCSMVSVLEL